MVDANGNTVATGTDAALSRLRTAYEQAAATSLPPLQTDEQGRAGLLSTLTGCRPLAASKTLSSFTSPL